MDENEEDIVAEETVRWAIFQDVNSLTFIGKNIYAVCDKLHIYFFNVLNRNKLIYNATNTENGDGVECFAGHRTSQMFVFAEIRKFPRIFLLTYPEFKVMRTMSDPAVAAYAAVGLTELEQIITLSKYPNYTLTVWCWRTNKKLISCDTGIRSPKFYFRCSFSHSLIFHGWDKKYSVWEVIPCYKTCMLLPRQLSGKIPSIVDVTWTPEGNIYCVNKEAIYSIVSDGINMIPVKDWSLPNGPYDPIISYFSNGLIIYGPDLIIRHLSKVNKEWNEDWSYTPEMPIVKMETGGLGETLIIVSESGQVNRIFIENGKVEDADLGFWQRSIQFIGIMNPFGNTLVTVNTENLVCLWNGVTGQLLSRTKVNNIISYISCSPTSPLIAMCIRADDVNGVCVMHAETQLRVMCFRCLTSDVLNHVVWTASGNELIASSLITGQVFFLKYKIPPNIDVLNMINIKSNLVDCWSVAIEKDLYFMCLALVVNVYTNIPEKVLMCYNFLTSKNIKTYGRIEATLMKVVHLEKNVMIGVNALPKELQVFSVSLEGDFLKLNCDHLFPLDFEISGINMNKDRGGIMFWGMDGQIYYKTSVYKANMKLKIKGRHFFDKCIKNVLFDPQQRYAVSLSYCGALIVHNVASNVVIKGVDLTENFDTPEEITIFDIFDECNETWIQRIEDIKEKQEIAQWAELRSNLEKEFNSLQERLLVLLEDNISAPPMHQLPLNIFNLHTEGQTQRAKEAAEERNKVHTGLEEQIKTQDKVTEWIISKCWTPVDVIGKEIHAIFTPNFVENYALLPKLHANTTALAIVENYRIIESTQDERLFIPWIPPAIVAMIMESVVSIKAESVEEVDEELKIEVSETKTIEEFLYQMTGSSAHLFITPFAHSYPQMLTQSNMQMRWQTTMTEHNTNLIKMWFNKQFDDMMVNKQKELSMIEDKNKRLNVIISELNILSVLKESEDRINIYISNPQWVQEEIPAKLLNAEEDEVGITPYISPSQVVIPPPDLGPKDDFREKALMYMMDGVLEKLWHEEIKKTIPKPQCMLTKEPEDYSEEDLKLINEWEKNVEFRNQERDKYRKMLRMEYAKLSSSLNEMIGRFNQKIRDFYILKLKVDSAVGQENLKLMRFRVDHLIRIETVENIHNLELQTANNEMEIENVHQKLHEVQMQQSDCQTAYEALMTRDRTLEKNFKASFSDVSPIVADLCYKLYKKRPKWQQRASMTAGVLYEMAHTCLTKERPEFLHVDCNDFLKGLDQLDLISNMPPVLDETAWMNMCKLRRVKIDNEIKVKAVCADIAEVEAANTIWQKRASNLRGAGLRMRAEISQNRNNIEISSRNVSVQLVMKSGIVEVETTGHQEDFDIAVLIKLEDVDAINFKILEAGELKLKAMRQTTSFKKHILSMEWEHAKLKMKIRHLQQDIYHLERIKVTKEIRKYLQEKTRKMIAAALGNANIERQIENTRKAFNNQLYGYMHRVEELEMTIGSIRSNIEKTDQYVSLMKIRVSEKHHAEDPAAKKKKLKVQAHRMEAMVLRSRLLSEVQQQYLGIVLLQTELELQRLRTYPTLSQK